MVILLIYSTIHADVGQWMGLKIQKHADVILEWSPIVHSSEVGVKIGSKLGLLIY